MSEGKPLIEQERMGLWISVNFILTLLALGMAILAFYRVNVTIVGTRVEAIEVNKRLEALEAGKTNAPTPP